MKYNYTEEFDLKTIYNKLVQSRNVPTVKACDFFKKESELEKLQRKMSRIFATKPTKSKTAK